MGTVLRYRCYLEIGWDSRPWTAMTIVKRRVVKVPGLRGQCVRGRGVPHDRRSEVDERSRSLGGTGVPQGFRLTSAKRYREGRTKEGRRPG